MKRRQAIEYLSVLVGGAISAPTLSVLQGCQRTVDVSAIGLGDPITKKLLDAITETIIPRTDTPGAKDAKVADFILGLMSDCYELKYQTIFLDGIKAIEKKAQEMKGDGFIDLNGKEQKQLLSKIDKERSEFKDQANGPHYFQLIKELTLFGFFTSQEGAEQVLRYTETPGRYEGCIPYKKGEKAWAT